MADSDLADLRHRLTTTRWPDHLDGVGWDYGTEPGYLRELADYWATGFDWRRAERWLNTFPQFRADGLHYIHQPGRGPAPLPVLLLHGWPGSFVQMLDLLPLLTDDFDVVVGSLPGFAFSDAATRPGMSEAGMAHVFHRLMTEVLGYRRYAVRGGDFGAGIAEQMAAHYPEAVVGIHLTSETPRADDPPENPGPAIRRYLRDVELWQKTEAGYARQQSTRPQTLAYALNDSPVGLAGWLVEKYRRWSDCAGDVERRFTKDQLLTTISLYWFTGTIGSSMRLYYETAHQRERRPDVPIARLMSTKDMVRTPREWVERRTRIDRWTEVDRGGHFLEWEEPRLVADDMRAFFGGLADV